MCLIICTLDFDLNIFVCFSDGFYGSYNLLILAIVCVIAEMGSRGETIPNPHVKLPINRFYFFKEIPFLCFVRGEKVKLVILHMTLCWTLTLKLVSVCIPYLFVVAR